MKGEDKDGIQFRANPQIWMLVSFDDDLVGFYLFFRCNLHQYVR